MRLLLPFIIMILSISCMEKKEIKSHKYSSVEITSVLNDSISIRALEIGSDGLMYAGSRGKYGYYAFNENCVDNKIECFFDSKQDKKLMFEGKEISFRAIASTSTHFFVLSIANPAVLFKINKENGTLKNVYVEKHEKVFYDAMTFWNDEEGIAMGDPIGDCLSILITRDGGESWNKVPCSNFPKVIKGEAAFAASNSNIKVVGDKTWIASGGITSRVYFSKDKGKQWEVFETPMINGKNTTGTYSMDFYDENIGMLYGGDYTAPDQSIANKAITIDGGKTWNVKAENQQDGVYKSCVQFVPNSGSQEIVAVGFTGISISNDQGNHWKKISNESFYTIRFLNDSVAFAAGKNRISMLKFK